MLVSLQQSGRKLTLLPDAPQNREEAFHNCQELHIPAPMEEESPHADVMSHAWLDFVGECYPKFLAADDFDANATPEMELFYQRVGAFVRCGCLGSELTFWCADGPRRDLRRRVEDLELEREALEKEWAELQSTPVRYFRISLTERR